MLKSTGTKTCDNGWRQWMTENLMDWQFTIDLLLWMTINWRCTKPYVYSITTTVKWMNMRKKIGLKDIWWKKAVWYVNSDEEEACLKLKFN